MSKIDDDIRLLNRVLFILLIGIPISAFLVLTAAANAIANVFRP